MTREDIALEISMRKGIHMEDVEEVLKEEENIIEEERRIKKKKKCIFVTVLVTFFLLGAAAAMYVLDKKNKIDVERVIKEYADKFKLACSNCSCNK